MATTEKRIRLFMDGPVLRQNQELRQEQILAPQQIQSLEILLAPLLQLQARISQELEENPVLEQESHPNEDLSGDLSAADNEDGASGSGDKDERELEELLRLADSWRDQLPPSHSRTDFTEEDEEKRQHFFNSLTQEPSIQEQLLNQMSILDLDERQRQIAELIIGSVDEKGYLRSHLADIATVSGAEMREVRKVLDTVQNLEPPGIAARDLKECLMLQLKAAGKDNGPLGELVEKHLDDIGRNKLPLVAKSMGISIGELHDLIDQIRVLNPQPGTVLSPNNPVFVTPEVTVEKVDGEYLIHCADDSAPRLRISSFYRKMIEDPATSEEIRDYIKEKLLRAKQFIKCLSQRRSTIYMIAEVIVDTQHDFLEKGVEHLRPLTMQQVADKIGMHETTVSRAIANKYIKTPAGLFEFKFFFSTGYSSEDGEKFSSRSVMEKIRDMISRENTAKPLSDSAISEKLKESGLPVARRTVAKYREEMGIPSSHLRKEY